MMDNQNSSENIVDVHNQLQPELLQLFFSYARNGRAWLNTGTPWFTLDSVSWLEANTTSCDTVFEIGGGRSTMWWASRVSTVTTLETSPDWIIQIMFFLYSNPHLLRKVRLMHVPADWHPDWKNGRKAYWTKNDCSMTFADISLLERDYINCLGRNNNATILCLDGGIRCFSMVFLAERNLLEQYEIIVLDNTEARFHSMYWEPFLKDKFIRFDFVTGHLRQLKNPKLNHVTTVFVRKDRVAKCRQVPLENKTQWEMQELCLHQSFEYNEESRVIVNNFADHVKKKLQGHGLL